jgi:microsomal dipeptidase-like Zn-dependent dipeptidase
LRRIRWAGTVAAAAVTCVFAFLPAAAERHFNRVHAPPRAVSERARALHARLLIADLHVDSLLWGRDLLARGRRGHVDVPRMAEGNLAVAGFTVVTKTPRRQNIDRNDDATDNITLLAIAQRWPPRTWGSLRERALYQAARLRDAAARSDGALTLVRSRGDLDDFLERRAGRRDLAAGFLGLEGAHPLGADPAGLDELFAAGYRMIAPVHFFDTAFAGSAHGVAKGGLTPAGRALVAGLEQRSMLLDLAHASEKTIDDSLAMARRPVVVSHTGVKGTCDNPRNLSDAHLRGVARTRGVVGIGFWETAVCGAGPDAIARAVRHAVSVAGIEHVGLGSDFDGAVSTPFDASGLASLTEALIAEGFSDEDVARIMGANAIRVLQEALP